MDIRKDHDYITLPEFIEERTAEFAIYPKGNPEQNPSSYALLVQNVPFNELVEMKAAMPAEAKISGIPRYWALAIIEREPRLFMWPTPAQDMFAKFRYCPAMKEI